MGLSRVIRTVEGPDPFQMVLVDQFVDGIGLQCVAVFLQELLDIFESTFGDIFCPAGFLHLGQGRPHSLVIEIVSIRFLDMSAVGKEIFACRCSCACADNASRKVLLGQQRNAP